MRHVALLAFLKHFLGLYQLMFNCEGNSIKVNANRNELEVLQAFHFVFPSKETLFNYQSSSLDGIMIFKWVSHNAQLFWHSKSFSLQKLNMLITNNRLLWYLSAFGNISIASSFRRFSLSEFNSVRCLPETREKHRMKWVRRKKNSRVCTNWW